MACLAVSDKQFNRAQMNCLMTVGFVAGLMGFLLLGRRHWANRFPKLEFRL